MFFKQMNGLSRKKVKVQILNLTATTMSTKFKEL